MGYQLRQTNGDILQMKLHHIKFNHILSEDFARDFFIERYFRLHPYFQWIIE